MKYYVWFVLIVAGCKTKDSTKPAEYKELVKDVAYQHVSEGLGATPKYGEYLKLEVRQTYGDTVLLNTNDSWPQYQQLDSTTLSRESFEIFKKLRVGDSLVFKVENDSNLRRSRPELYKQHKTLVTFVKVLGILANEDSVRAEVRRIKGEPDPMARQEQGYGESGGGMQMTEEQQRMMQQMQTQQPQQPQPQGPPYALPQ